MSRSIKIWVPTDQTDYSSVPLASKKTKLATTALLSGAGCRMVRSFRAHSGSHTHTHTVRRGEKSRTMASETNVAAHSDGGGAFPPPSNLAAVRIRRIVSRLPPAASNTNPLFGFRQTNSNPGVACKPESNWTRSRRASAFASTFRAQLSGIAPGRG